SGGTALAALSATRSYSTALTNAWPAVRPILHHRLTSALPPGYYPKLLAELGLRFRRTHRLTARETMSAANQRGLGAAWTNNPTRRPFRFAFTRAASQCHFIWVRAMPPVK